MHCGEDKHRRWDIWFVILYLNSTLKVLLKNVTDSSPKLQFMEPQMTAL